MNDDDEIVTEMMYTGSRIAYLVCGFAVFLIAQVGGRGQQTRGEIDFEYRVADTVKAMYHGPFSKLREKIPAHFPDSIACAYVNASEISVCAQLGNPSYTTQAMVKRQACYDDKVAILDSVLKSKCGVWDKASKRMAVLHVRLGDAFCATTEYVVDSLKPPTPEDVFGVAKKYMSSDRPLTVIYSTHGGCENETSVFLDQLQRLIEPFAQMTIEEGVGWKDVDKHLCYMAGADLFIEGAGGFSYLAERVRERRGKLTVKELVRSPIVWLQADLEHEQKLRKKAVKENALAS